jgi:hypothetical protein
MNSEILTEMISCINHVLYLTTNGKYGKDGLA